MIFFAFANQSLKLRKIINLARPRENRQRLPWGRGVLHMDWETRSVRYVAWRRLYRCLVVLRCVQKTLLRAATSWTATSLFRREVLCRTEASILPYRNPVIYSQPFFDLFSFSNSRRKRRNSNMSWFAFMRARALWS